MNLTDIWRVLLGPGGLVHIFVRDGKEISHCVQTIRHHSTQFIRPGDQVAGICAVLA